MTDCHFSQRETPSFEEKTKLIFWMIGQMRAREYEWLQYKSGAMDKESWESYRGVIYFVLGTERARALWGLTSTETAKFLEQVDASVVHEAHSVRGTLATLLRYQAFNLGTLDGVHGGIASDDGYKLHDDVAVSMAVAVVQPRLWPQRRQLPPSRLPLARARKKPDPVNEKPDPVLSQPSRTDSGLQNLKKTRRPGSSPPPRRPPTSGAMHVLVNRAAAARPAVHVRGALHVAGT